MLEVVEIFKYLGSLMTAVGGVEAGVQQRVLDGREIQGALRSVLKGRTMIWRVKKHCTSRI